MKCKNFICEGYCDGDCIHDEHIVKPCGARKTFNRLEKAFRNAKDKPFTETFWQQWQKELIRVKKIEKEWAQNRRRSCIEWKAWQKEKERK